MNYLIVETILRRAVLGLQFSDLVLGQLVAGGLNVFATPLDESHDHVLASLTEKSRVYGFESLPEFFEYEIGYRPVTDWCDAANPSDNYAITVIDTLQRFLPIATTLCVPSRNIRNLMLFSAYERETPAGMWKLTGRLWNRMLDEPAAWAILSIQAQHGPNSENAVGMSSESGTFAIFLPFSTFANEENGEMPATLSVTINVAYAPDEFVFISDAPIPPDIRSLLSQSPAELFDKSNVPSRSELVRQIPFGNPPELTTEDEPYLLVKPI